MTYVPAFSTLLCMLIINQVYFSCLDIDIISTTLGNELQHVATWLQANKLSFHVGSTNCMFIGAKKNLQTELNIILDNDKIQQVKSFKYFGVTLNNEVKFCEQLGTIIN